MATSLISAGILFSFFPFSSPAIHSLKYQFMATSGIPAFSLFAINGYVDDIIAFHYDSETRRVVPRQEWIKDSLSDYWDAETEKAHGAERVYRSNIEILQKRFNQTRGVHTVQYMYGCQFDDESGHTNGFKQHGYDGEDFLSLDVGNKRWIASVPEAVVTAHKWNHVTPLLEAQIQYLTKGCIDWLKNYVLYGHSTLTRTDFPNVSVFKRQDTGQVLCHATGFYPDGVMITWKKDGVEIQDDVIVGETLPNEDGTFQKRAVLMLSPDELQGITCEVEHRSGTQIRPLILERPSSTPPLGLLMGAVIGGLCLIVLSCFFFVKNKFWRRMSCDPNTKTSPVMVPRSSDDSLSAPRSDLSLDSMSSVKPLMAGSKDGPDRR